MKHPTVFHLVSSEFAKAGISCVLIGGFAVNYYGVTRQTADVDLLITFVVPSLNHLIALKLHSIKFNQKIREFKDMPDIINLLRINKVNVRTERFRKLCLKYGTEELYRKILENVDG